MKSNYRKIGDYIELIDERNTGHNVKNLLGLSISKQFIPSVANIIGTDMENYKIIRKNQFACSTMQVRRDKKMPVALLQEIEEAIISQAYPVFKVKDQNLLLPEYLMMWFTRSEFDREACFKAVGGVRGSLEWEDFCDMKLPIPSISKQHEIVKEYNVIQNRIDLNNKLIQKLEETAQAIYKQWFVDFEFPDENGRPYKSNGGEMVENELGDIPIGWKSLKLGNLVRTQYGFTASADFKNIGPKLLRITDIAQNQIKWQSVPHCKVPVKVLDKYLLNFGDIVIARTGATAGYAKRINKKHPKAVFASYLVRMIALDGLMNIYLGMTVDSAKYREYILTNSEGSAQPQANAALMSEFQVFKPTSDVLLKLNKCIGPLFDQIEIFQIQNAKLFDLGDLLLSKLATIEN